MIFLNKLKNLKNRLFIISRVEVYLFILIFLMCVVKLIDILVLFIRLYVERV